MATWTNDPQLHSLMRAYVSAVARVDAARAQQLPAADVERLESDKREAARAYEDALLARGWQIPGLAIGSSARSSRW
jgi:hypothetical protein